MNINAYKFKFGLMGLVLPFTVYYSAFLVAMIPVFYILWYPIFLIIMIPGYLTPGKGLMTMILPSLFWGIAGFAIGYARDHRVADDEKEFS